MADFFADDAEIYDGAHVSLAIVCRRLEEEKVLAISEYVSAVIHGSG
jgi:amidase